MTSPSPQSGKKELNLPIPFNYRARPYQIEFWSAMASGIKRAVLVWHRRAGKEKTCFNYMIKEAVKRVGIYYYIFPDSKMARRILWDGIDKEGFKTLKHIPEELVLNMNNTEMKIVLRNGSIILVLGSHDVDSLRGPNPIGVVFSEYAEQHPQAWQIVSPILRENGGWAIWNFTPKGHNHAKDLLDLAVAHKDTWFSQVLTINDTNVITKEDIEKERAESMMSEDMIQQEYYCSFTLGIEGSYYAKYIKEAKDEGRVTNVPWDRQALVNTVWDIGYGDSTAIIFYQLVGKEIHIIDYYENHGEGLPHYKKILADKPYNYEEHFAPHDIESHAFSSGLSAKEVGAKLGISFITLPTLKLRIEDGIEALRGVFPRIWIDSKKCAPLVKALENYRKEFDDKNNVYKSRPLHDWCSHAADSARYMAIAVRMFADKSYRGIDDKQSEEWFRKFNPRFE